MVSVNADATGYENKWNLNYTAPEGEDTILFAFYLYGTSQTSKPAVKSSYAINYVSRDGINAWFDFWGNSVLTEDFQKTISENGDVELFVDSCLLYTSRCV